MINENRRKAIQALFEEGRTKKEIARYLNLDPKTVRKVLAGGGTMSPKRRSDKKVIDIDLLRETYKQCNGYIWRVYEKLNEELGIKAGYSTVTRMIRENGIGRKADMRCHRVPDVPGEEMQHDTSPYTLKIGKGRMRLICSGLYLRYSKMRYIKFYPGFNRFKMKCFFYEALTHWKHSAKRCVVDNTNLVILHGTGANAVFHPEMAAFAKPYGFDWFAHEKGHANRKAGTERNFWTVEQNFFPGRTFETIEDLNRQAFEWAAGRYARRPQAKTRLIPADVFEQEKPYLNRLPGYVEPPYLEHLRKTDPHGYVALNVNYYWIPGKGRPKVRIIEYPGHIRIFPEGQESIEYPLPAWDVRNERFKPDGVRTNPYEPRNIKKPCHEEEKRIRDMGEVCCAYLDFIKSKESEVRYKKEFIRRLYGLSGKMGLQLFIATLERALGYRVEDIDALTRISCQLMRADLCESPGPIVTGDYEQREAYQQGRFSQEREPGLYQDLCEEKKDEEKSHE